MATLLSICADAADIVGIQQPAGIMAGADQTARTLRACAQREGMALSRRWNWQRLTMAHTFTSTATTIQADGLPSGWSGRMVSDTFYNRTQKRGVRGPLNPQEWQAYLALTAPVVTDAFRIQEGALELLPTPAAGWTYAFEYVSSEWCESATGTGQARWAADTDVPRLDEELFTLGVIWRYLQSRGLEYAEAMRSYEIEVNNAMLRDGARRTVDLRGNYGTMDRPRYPAVPEGSWVV